MNFLNESFSILTRGFISQLGTIHNNMVQYIANYAPHLPLHVEH